MTTQAYSEVFDPTALFANMNEDEMEEAGRVIEDALTMLDYEYGGEKNIPHAMALKAVIEALCEAGFEINAAEAKA